MINWTTSFEVCINLYNFLSNIYPENGVTNRAENKVLDCADFYGFHDV